MLSKSEKIVSRSGLLVDFFPLDYQRMDVNFSQFTVLLRLFKLFTFAINCSEQWATFFYHHLKRQAEFHAIVRQNQTMKPIVGTTELLFSACSKK